MLIQLKTVAMKVHMNLNSFQGFVEHESKNIFKVFLNSPLFCKLLLTHWTIWYGKVRINHLFFKYWSRKGNENQCLLSFSILSFLLFYHLSSCFHSFFSPLKCKTFEYQHNYFFSPLNSKGYVQHWFSCA